MLEKLVRYVNSIDTFKKYEVKGYSEGTSLLLVQLGLVLLYNQSVLGILFLLGHPDENKSFVSITAKFYSQLGDTRMSKNRMTMSPIIRKYLDAPLQLKSHSVLESASNVLHLTRWEIKAVCVLIHLSSF